MAITGNATLENLDDLSGLTKIGVDLYVAENPQLKSVAGLQNVTRVGSIFMVRDNPALPTCAATGLRDAIGLANIGGDITIEGNDDAGICP